MGVHVITLSGPQFVERANDSARRAEIHKDLRTWMARSEFHDWGGAIEAAI